MSHSEILFGVNTFHFELLTPLTKWLVLSLEEIHRLSEKKLSYWHVQRKLKKLEEAQIIKSFRCPWSGRKFVYFERRGKEMLGVSRDYQDSNEALIHDYKLSEFCLALSTLKVIKEIKLRHELPKKLFGTGDFCPDALVKGDKNKVNFTMSLDFKLTSLCNERMLSNAKHYLNSSLIDYCFFLFCTRPLLLHYKKVFDEGLPKGWNNKFILCCNTSLITKKLELSKGEIIFKEKENSFDSIFL